jgi:hypothetical protein
MLHLIPQAMLLLLYDFCMVRIARVAEPAPKKWDGSINIKDYPQRADNIDNTNFNF